MEFLSIVEIKENIMEEVEDNEFEEEISREWAYNTIEKEYQMLLEESKSWKRPTDTERLIIAFDELCELNIIALHNTGYTTGDGEDIVVEVESELRTRGKKSNGYYFYQEQDFKKMMY